MFNFKKILSICLCLAALICVLASCGEGAQGPKGEQGIQGEPGTQGEKGETGEKGEDGITPTVSINEEGYWVINGIKTEYKAVGEDGKDGISPTVEISNDGYWILNGTKTDHKVSGQDGKDGDNGKTPALRINSETNEWEVSYNDGESWTSLGVKATGEKGEDGENGENGNDGATIESVTFNEDGKLVITMTNEKVFIVDMPEKEEHIHNYGALVDFGDNSALDCDKRIYYSVCDGCSEMKWVYGKYADHDFATTYSTDGFYHWFACEKCNAKDKLEEHSIGEDGYCDVCEQPLTPSEGIVYEIVDGQAEVIDYTGTAKKIVIADTYEGAPVKAIADYAFYDKNITSVIIPEGVTEIGNSAFWSCNDLTDIDIPSTVVTIKDGAFSLCNSLKTIVLPDGMEEISDSFSYCSNLKSVTFPKNLKSIAEGAFESCGTLLKRENGVAYVNDWAVDFDDSSTSVKLRDGTVGIANGVFHSSNKLRSIVLPSSVLYIGASAFKDCDIAEIEIPNNVISIGKEAFYSCGNLTTLTIPNSVTDIGESAFSCCYVLASITIGSGVTNIGRHAFHYCPELEEVTFSENSNLVSIGEFAFEDCYKLSSLTIPYGVVSIERSAFQSCNNLTSVDLPISLTNIASGAFNECASLTNVYYSGTESDWNAVEIGAYNENLTSATFHFGKQE